MVIPFEKELVRAGDYTVSSGYKAILEMESAGLDYSAVICANDLMALGAINALKELSYRIPEDVQVIGYDNMFFSQIYYPGIKHDPASNHRNGENCSRFHASGIGR